jgi:hypothetical protein
MRDAGCSRHWHPVVHRGTVAAFLPTRCQKHLSEIGAVHFTRRDYKAYLPEPDGPEEKNANRTP